MPLENILYLGGPNIASEIYNKEYANARICGADKWRMQLAKFLRQPQFIVWDNSDLVTHEVMGGLKNVYAIGAGKRQYYYIHIQNDLGFQYTAFFSELTRLYFLIHQE